MPALKYKNIIFDKREGFLEELLRIREAPEFTYQLGAYTEDMISFVTWANSGENVPEGAWWVRCGSFNVSGDGAITLRPLHHSLSSDGEYLGKIVQGKLHKEKK